MADVTVDDPARVLAFWFGELDEHGLASAETSARWFRKDPAFDQELRDRFGALHRAIVAGEHEAWRDTAHGALAYVIVLDQFSRNMFRDTPEMFAYDPQALAAAEGAIARGDDRALPTHMRAFLYLPRMHSEELGHQDGCVAAFEAWCADLSGPAHDAIAGNLKYAIAHRDIVARFGRFPHRNALLGRATTDAEAAFLAQPGSSF